jgi:hypothetical protein
MQTYTPTEHDKAEWSRMAQDAYKTGRNFFGHRYSMAATLRRNEAMRLDVFDTLQHVYRQWLVFGWSEVESPR